MGLLQLGQLFFLTLVHYLSLHCLMLIVAAVVVVAVTVNVVVVVTVNVVVVVTVVHLKKHNL